MLTHRHIERLWNQEDHRKLFAALAVGRAEFPADVVAELAGRPLSTAALAVIRLAELNQTRCAVFPRLVNFLLASRDIDHIWGDVMTSAMVIRALRVVVSSGPVVDESCRALAALQKDDGSFPDQAVRRMTGDPLTTALVIALLGDDRTFADAISIDAALKWLARSAPSTLRNLVRVAGLRSHRLAA